jgi:DNA-binding beta-propeller fold protein YncE
LGGNCPICNFLNVASDRFCGQCGQPLDLQRLACSCCQPQSITTPQKITEPPKVPVDFTKEILKPMDIPTEPIINESDFRKNPPKIERVDTLADSHPPLYEKIIIPDGTDDELTRMSEEILAITEPQFEDPTMENPTLEQSFRMETSSSPRETLIFALDSMNTRIQILTEAGEHIRSFGEIGPGHGQFENPQKIAIDEKNRWIYVSDFNNNRVQKFDLEGNFVSTIGRPGSREGEFNFPQGLAVDSDGNLYVADEFNDRIQVFSSDGKFLDLFAEKDELKLDTPSGITITKDNQIIVIDSSSRLLHFDQDFNLLQEMKNFDNPLGTFSDPRGLAVAADGRIFVADTQNNMIKVISADGRFLQALGSNGNEPGQFDTPSDLFVTEDGFIYVADTWNHRIQVFDPELNFLSSIGGFGHDPGKFNHILDVKVVRI